MRTLQQPTSWLSSSSDISNPNILSPLSLSVSSSLSSDSHTVTQTMPHTGSPHYSILRSTAPRLKSYEPTSKFNSPSIRSLPVVRFFPQDLDYLVTHRCPTAPGFPPRVLARDAQVEHQSNSLRNSNSVLSIEWLSLHSYSRPFSSFIHRLFAFWFTSTLVFSCHINDINEDHDR